MIEEIPIAKLDPRQIKQLESADEMAQGNPTYALEIYGAILKQNQGCLELRRKLRSLQFKKLLGATKGLSSILTKVTSAPFMFRGKGDKDPEGTIVKAEGLLEKSPANTLAHQMLAEGSSVLGMVNTVVFAYETIRKIQPKDIKNLKELGNAYLEAGYSDMAIKTGNTIRQINPNDGDAEDLLKRASVAVAMDKGKWEESEDYRTQLKDESEAQSLEQASKTVNDSKSLEDLIRQTYQKVEEEPSNLNHYRQLSDYYQRYGDLENAIAWIQEARKQEGGLGDVTLEEKERQLTLQYFDQSIDACEKARNENPSDPNAQASLEEAKRQRNHYQQTQLESLVRRYPNDFGNRYELGLFLFENGQYDDSLPHFQLAQRNAKVRPDAILHLGRAYSRKNFHDLAIEQFSILKNEIQVMDDRKKNAIYELGCCFEAMGKKEKAIAEYKLVYSTDITFRDVSDKINAFYEQNS
jgi:tetratricopeptide (TPR) repeat protein